MVLPGNLMTAVLFAVTVLPCSPSLLVCSFEVRVACSIAGSVPARPLLLVSGCTKALGCILTAGCAMCLLHFLISTFAGSFVRAISATLFPIIRSSNVGSHSQQSLVPRFIYHCSSVSAFAGSTIPDQNHACLVQFVSAHRSVL